MTALRHRGHGRRLLALLAAALLAPLFAACSDRRVTAPPPPPPNHSPIISSLIAFPTDLGLTDSLFVVCIASDPDGDALVYDWFTDARLKIKGNRPDDHGLYDSPDNTHIFYRDYITPDTTAWVQCIVRDHRGGATGRIVKVRLHQ